MPLSCPLGITRCVPREKFSVLEVEPGQTPYNKSFSCFVFGVLMDLAAFPSRIKLRTWPLNILLGQQLIYVLKARKTVPRNKSAVHRIHFLRLQCYNVTLHYINVKFYILYYFYQGCVGSSELLPPRNLRVLESNFSLNIIPKELKFLISY